MYRLKIISKVNEQAPWEIINGLVKCIWHYPFFFSLILNTENPKQKNPFLNSRGPWCLEAQIWQILAEIKGDKFIRRTEQKIQED